MLFLHFLWQTGFILGVIFIFYSWLKVLKNFEVLFNEITVYVEFANVLCQSIYISTYPFVYLHIFIQLCMRLYLDLSFYLSLPIYNHNKMLLFSDWTTEALAKTKYTLFGKWHHFMVNIFFDWHLILCGIKSLHNHH